jgi:hypothetical protein
LIHSQKKPGGDDEIASLRTEAEDRAFPDKKYGQSYKIATGICEKAGAGSFLVALFQNDQNSLVACSVGVAFFVLSALFNFRAPD